MLKLQQLLKLPITNAEVEAHTQNGDMGKQH